MVFNHPQYGYPPSNSEFAIDGRQGEFYSTGEDGEAVPSPVMFAGEMMSSPDAQNRRSSLPTSSGVLSPANSLGWDQQVGAELEPASSNAFRQPTLRNGMPRVQTFVGQAHPPWPYETHSGHVTPSPATAYPPTYPGNQPPPQYIHHPMEGPQPMYHPQTLHAQARQQSFQGPPPPDAHFIPMSQSQPKSPHSHQDYMLMAQAEVEGRAASKRIRPGSPVRTSVDAQRRDGVRKKNGRIEIPQERNITHIDELLEQEDNEDMIKELKQQKRLLRNREAALASRQRKKKHTEELEQRLEQREKICQDTVQSYQLRIQELEHRDRHWQRSEQELQRQLQVAHDDYQRLQQRLDEETSMLRRRIQLLNEQVDAGPAPAMSALPSSTGFTECNAGMEALDMGDWNEFIDFDDINDIPDNLTFAAKPEPVIPRPALERKSFSTNDAAARSDETQESSFGSGLLFFLLLCGAFVVSKPGSSKLSNMPAIPDNVRAAAPAVLDNLLNDGTSQSIATSARRDSTLEPRQSSIPTRSQGSRLERMHQRMITPSKQQEIEQTWSLTTTQYASISDPDFYLHDNTEDHRSSHRPTLAETLAQSQREYTRNSKAEVYTRSLLMDRIPADVVAQFKEMVRDHNEIEARQQQQTIHDDDHFTYKVEA